MSKGSGRRPKQISQEEFEDNWNKIFGRKGTKAKGTQVDKKKEARKRGQ